MSYPRLSPRSRETHRTFLARSSRPADLNRFRTRSRTNFSPSCPRRRLRASRSAKSILRPFLDSHGLLALVEADIGTSDVFVDPKVLVATHRRQVNSLVAHEPGRRNICGTDGHLIARHG